jgi:hypothetical protein
LPCWPDISICKNDAAISRVLLWLFLPFRAAITVSPSPKRIPALESYIGNAILHGKEGQPDLHGTKGIEGVVEPKQPGAKRAGVACKFPARKQWLKRLRGGLGSPYHRVKIASFFQFAIERFNGGSIVAICNTPPGAAATSPDGLTTLYGVIAGDG